MAGIFKDAAQSFYSGPFYGRLARQRRGIGLGLIAFLTLLISGMMCIGLFTDTQLRDAVNQLPKVADSLPVISLSDAGKLSINKPVPYRITLGPETTSPILMIDTEYKLNDATGKYMHDNNIIALITADNAILAKNQHRELDIYEFKGNQSLTITHEQWLKLAGTVSQWGFPALVTIFFISFSIAMFILNIIATVLSAVVVMILDMTAQTELDFAAAMRLAAGARIPINILPVLPTLFGVPGIASASGWVLWGIYLFFAVWAVRLYSAQGAR